MGKRSQAKSKWLTMSQRAAKGEAQSGARLWFLDPKKPKPHTTQPIPPRGEAERAQAVSEQAAQLHAVQAVEDGVGKPVEAQGAGEREGVPA